MTSPLRRARDHRGITLQHLATLVQSDVGNLSRIERGVQTPSKTLAEKICFVFAGEINELQLIYPSRFPEKASQPPSPANILDTVPAHSVVLPTIPPSLDPKEKP